jgi:hypothetical protein
VKTLLSLALMLASTAFANGGGVTGEDGGHGVLCQARSQHLGSQYDYTLEVLDLFEARRQKPGSHPHVIPNFVYGSFRANMVCRILEIKQKLLSKRGMTQKIARAFDQACELAYKIEIVDDAIPTHDAGAVLTEIPRHCKIVQLANRVETVRGERFYLDREYSGYLNEIDVAALLLHESLHKYSTAPTTRPIRKFVGSVFTH